MHSLPYYYSGNAPVIQGGIPPKIPRRFFRKQNAGRKKDCEVFLTVLLPL